jgi:hypothetical protein
MIHEYSESIPEDFKVSVAAVHPFTNYPVCPKCGYNLGAGIKPFAIFKLAQGECACGYAYCAGGLNSQAQMPTLNIATGQLGTAPVNVPCFGIFTEHLHMSCNRCRFNWLMAVKGGK